MTVSIIIAVKIWQGNLEECVRKCRELDYPASEIIILPDQPLRGAPEDKIPAGPVPIRVIPTGAVSPARKRDIALGYARGEVLAFIDDDAYPAKEWLENALENFKDEGVAAVGGPAVTPPQDNLRQQASGIVYSSILVSGRYIYRYAVGKKREVDDYPTCNFLVRAAVMKELRGFATDFWPGEDTKLCLEITKRLKKKIMYAPGVLVYHHRRPLVLPHLSQIANYGLHRGYFSKRYPETSLRIAYFLPSFFLAAIVIGAGLAFFWASLRPGYFLALFLYLLLALIVSISNGLKENNPGIKLRQRPLLIALVFTGIILTHLTYGLFFIKGLLSGGLKEEI